MLLGSVKCFWPSNIVLFLVKLSLIFDCLERTIIFVWDHPLRTSAFFRGGSGRGVLIADVCRLERCRNTDIGNVEKKIIEGGGVKNCENLSTSLLSVIHLHYRRCLPNFFGTFTEILMIKNLSYLEHS